MLLCLLAGGWYLASNRVPRPESAADFRPDPGGRRGGFAFGNDGRNRVNIAPSPREPVNIGPRIVTVRDQDLTLSCTQRNASDWTINISFGGSPLATREQLRLLRAARRIVDSRQPPTSLHLTDAQRTDLAAISFAPPEINPDQLKRLTDLLDQSQKLKANAPEMAGIKTSLLALVGEIKTVDREAAKAKHAERDARLRTILSAEQITNLLGGRAGAGAESNP